MVHHKIIRWITTSAAINANNSEIGRLGLLLSNSSSAAIAKLIPNKNRILLSHFNNNPAIIATVHCVSREDIETRRY